jgi:F-type H+-transporting ATPase subunit b
MIFQEVTMHSLVLARVASGAEHPLIDVDGTIVIQFGLFLLMAFLATQWLFKPYLRMREERTKGIDGARQEAENLAAEASARRADYESKLAAARGRAYDEQSRIRAEATGYQREVTEKARAEAAKAVADAKAKVDSDVAAARAELTPKADALAANIAAKLLGREVA